jgi:lysophospholipase L1-like esterase
VLSRRFLSVPVLGGLVALAALVGGVEAMSGTSAPIATAPRSPSVAQTPQNASVRRLVRKASDVTVGNLEHPGRLAQLFARLEALEAHEAKTDVRIVQLGDSHTASDYGTRVARAALAARFGDGGRGFIPLGRPYKRLFQEGESMARGVAFAPDEAASLRQRADGLGGFCGPTGVAMDARVAGASMSSELAASADRFEIAYLAQPDGGGFDLYVDGRRVEHVATDATPPASAFRSVPVARGPHTLEVRAVGDGPVRVFGVRLDDDAVGVSLEALGINGAKATAALALDEAHFAEQMAHASPSLAVLAYGTNESGDTTTTPEQHAAALRAVAMRIRSGAKGAECIVLGPPDRASALPKLLELMAAQRRAADEAGCAFYDQFAAMGQAGAIRRWARESPPRARRDLVHLTRAGYAFLAEALVRDLVAAYERWKTETSAIASR